jgi:mRNA interferase MazF
MPTTTGFEFGDVVLVPFPFSDQITPKRRPAVIVSSPAYHRDRPDVIIMAITSRTAALPGTSGESAIERWKEAGLLRPSVFKPLLATIEGGLILRKLGRMHESDLGRLRQALDEILGE